MYLLAQYCIVKCVSVETQSGCVQRGLILEPTLENILDSVSLSAYAIHVQAQVGSYTLLQTFWLKHDDDVCCMEYVGKSTYSILLLDIC